jgi:hypothetical protein
MTGDQTDILGRIKGQLPPWFGIGATPILDALLVGVAWAMAWVYSLYAYAVLQVRLATATDGFLDMFAWDFFGPVLVRGDDDDTTFRRKITTSLMKERVTAAATIAILQQLTGATATISVTGPFAATITIAAGSVAHSEVLAAVEAVRPICSTLNVTFV